DPKRAEAYYNLGLIYRRQNQPELAVQAYREALHLNPKMADTHYNLGNLLLELGRFSQAVAHYQQALEIVPEFEIARLGHERAKEAVNLAATPAPTPAAASSGPGSGVRAPVVSLQRTLDPQFDGPTLHNLHRATIETENQGREFTRVLEVEMEPA